MGASDQSLVGSSDMTWIVSNGDLAKTPPLGIGHEVLSGGYHDGYILAGPSQYESSQVLNNSQYRSFQHGKPGEVHRARASTRRA
ncbi:MAG: hypothetical protein NTV68_03615 [Methanomicrobiales archaeon]|nr:hypothetical protein [Methanomicrobiales archaeon]